MTKRGSLQLTKIICYGTYPTKGAEKILPLPDVPMALRLRPFS